MDLSAKTGIDSTTLRMQSLPRLNSLANLPTRTDVLNRQGDIAQWFVDHPMHAAIAQDDAANLERIKQNMPNWTRQDWAYHHDTVGERVAASAKSIARFPISGIGQIGRMFYGAEKALADLVGDEDRSQLFTEKAEISGNLVAHIQEAITGVDFDTAERDQANITRLNYIKAKIGSTEISAEDIGAGLTSILPSLAAGPLGWGSVLATAGLQSATGAYADLTDRGDSGGKAATIALAEGLITAALTHYIPGAEGAVKRMLAASAAKTATARALMAKALGTTAASEFTEEGLDQFAQTMLNESTDTKNPKTFSAILGHAVSEGLKAGLIGGFSGAVVGYGEARHVYNVQSALKFHEDNMALAGAVDQSLMGQRSKESLKDFLSSQGMNQNSKVYLSGDDAKALLGGGAEQLRALADMGVTPKAVEDARARGGSLAVRASDLMSTEAALRGQVLEIARQTPQAMNSVEATEAKKVMDETKEESDDAKDRKSEFVKAMKKETDRIAKDVADLSGEDQTHARTNLTLLTAFARTSFQNDPLASRHALDIVKSFRVNKGGMNQTDVMQMITDLAGPEGKTAMANVSFTALGDHAARLDVLTGHLQFNKNALPDARTVAELIDASKKETLNLAGLKVNLGGAEVDAEGAVATMRKRVESARRLGLCLAGH